MYSLHLSRRERQVLDVLFQLGEATAADVRAALPDPPSDSAVRTHLRILGEKGLVTHTEEGSRYLYRPVQASDSAGRTALRHTLRTFFNGSPEQAVAALMDVAELSPDDLDRLAEMIDEARKAGR